MAQRDEFSKSIVTGSLAPEVNRQRRAEFIQRDGRRLIAPEVFSQMPVQVAFQAIGRPGLYGIKNEARNGCRRAGPFGQRTGGHHDQLLHAKFERQFSQLVFLPEFLIDLLAFSLVPFASGFDIAQRLLDIPPGQPDLVHAVVARPNQAPHGQVFRHDGLFEPVDLISQGLSISLQFAFPARRFPPVFRIAPGIKPFAGIIPVPDEEAAKFAVLPAKGEDAVARLDVAFSRGRGKQLHSGKRAETPCASSVKRRRNRPPYAPWCDQPAYGPLPAPFERYPPTRVAGHGLAKRLEIACPATRKPLAGKPDISEHRFSVGCSAPADRRSNGSENAASLETSRNGAKRHCGSAGVVCRCRCRHALTYTGQKEGTNEQHP